jgi:CxC6 like cysteine cluster associated with KDZ transposases
MNCKQDHFCEGHISQKYLCRADGCSEPLDEGFLTCSLPEHRERELLQRRRNGAQFQLASRLERGKVSAPPDTETLDQLMENGEAPDEGIEEGVVQEQGCPQKPETGNRKVTVRLARRQSHNEQIFARSCGMIVAASTFYGSESLSEVTVRFLHI